MGGVIIAYPSEKLALQLKRTLTACGFSVLAVYAKGSSVLNNADLFGEGVVVCPSILPDMPANHLADTLPPSFDVVALSAAADACRLGGNLTVLALPLNKNEFLSFMTSLCAQSACYAPSRRKTREPEEKELLEKAKQLFMRTKNMSESQAHRYLQRSAMNRGIKITEFARRVLERGG